MHDDSFEMVDQSEADEQQQKKNFSEQLAKEKRTVIETNQKLARAYVDLAELQSKLTNSENARRTLEGERADISHKLVYFQSQCVELETKLEREHAEAGKLSDQLKVSQTQNEIKEANIEDLEKANCTIRKQLAELADNMPQSDAQLKAALEAERSLHSDTKDNLQNLSDQLRAQTRKVTSLQGKVDYWRQESQRCKHLLKSLESTTRYLPLVSQTNPTPVSDSSTVAAPRETIVS